MKIERQPRTDQPKEYPSDMRITMAIPHKDIVHGIPGISLMTLRKFEEMAETTAKAGYEVFINTEAQTSNTPITRTRIVEQFKGDWLLMMDADAFPEAEVANRLLMAAKEDENNLRYIVAAPAVRPSYPHWACFGTITDSGLMVPWRYGIEFGDDEVDAVDTCAKKVDGTGFHCVLIHRDVFNAVGFPWFTLNVPDPDTGVIYGHDYTFCRAAKRAGFDTYIDFSARVGHYGIFPYTLANNRAIVQGNPQEAEKQRQLSIDTEAVLDEDAGTDPDYVLNYKQRLKKDQEVIQIPKEALE